MRHFHIRTTTIISRNFLLECENIQQAQKIAALLASEQPPVDFPKVTVRTLNDEFDVTSSTSAATESDWANSTAAVENPDWLK